MDITIDQLNTIASPQREHSLPAMRDGAGGRLTVAQILSLLQSSDLPSIPTGKISDAAVTNAKLANMVQATIKGRAAGAGTGAPVDLTPAQARTAMGLGSAAVVDTGVASGNIALLNANGRFDVARLGSGSPSASNFLRGDGAFAAPSIPVFQSAQQVLTAGGALTIAHGLGAEPNFIQMFIICTTANLNYAVNEKVLISVNTGASGNSRGISVVPDATSLNIGYSTGSDLIYIPDKSTKAVAAITIASWRLIVRAF